MHHYAKFDQVTDHREAFVSGKTDVRIVPKPWGHETIWAHTDLYVGKMLHITAGHALSLQYHNHKDETIHLLSGEMIYRVQIADRRRQTEDRRRVTDERRPRTEDRRLGATAWPGAHLYEVDLKPGESFRNEPGFIHQMEAVTDCVLLEVSTSHLDDVVRLTDRYGRQGTSAP
jgi:mannose-6-phosphate isomerase